MKQSKSSLTVVAICLVLFATGVYLKLSHQSEKIKTERAIKAQSKTAAHDPRPKPVDSPIPSASPSTLTPPAGPSSSPAPILSPAMSPTPLARQAPSPAVPSGSGALSADDRAAFQKVVAEARASIPSVAHLRSLPEDQVHETPLEIANAGIGVARVAEAVDKHPELASDAISFYGDCAVNSQYPTAVRSTCYLNMWRLYKKEGRAIESFPGDSKVTKQVKRIAQSLME